MKRVTAVILALTILMSAFNLGILNAYGATASLSKAYGWYEAIHLEWSNDSNASSATVSYKLSDESVYTDIDSELVRQNGSGGVADIVGITKGVYDVKITTSQGTVLTKTNIPVANHDRSGYGHFGLSGGLGGYNNDGTPKDNAQIVYVDNSNKNTVTLGSYEGLVDIVKNASSSKPLIVRIIGKVDTQTRDSDGTKTTDINNGVIALEGLTDKELSADSYFNMLDVSEKSNITIEGIGEDACIEKWGFTFAKCNSIEIRNLTFQKYPEDACSFEGSSSSNSKYKNYWVHNNYFKAGENKYDLTDEQDKGEGDGSSDFKGCRNITYSYNVFENCHKTSLHGGSDSSLQYNSTWHHNYFNNCSSRLPLTRQVNLHTYNNYYYNCGKCTDARASAWVFAERNYYDGCDYAFITTASSSYGDPIVKSYLNTFSSSSKKDSAKTITETTDRTLTISATLGSNDNVNPYPNFDTDPDVFYYDSTNKCSDVEYISEADSAKTDCLTAAGLMKADAQLSAYTPAVEENPTESTTEATTEAVTETPTETTTEGTASEREDKIQLLINKMLQEDGPENGSLWNKENTSAFKWSYINGCMATAMVKLSKATGDTRYQEFADSYMSPFIGTTSSSAKGYIADDNFKISNYSLDDLNSGKALIDLINLNSPNSDKYTRAVSETLIGSCLNYELENQTTAEGNLWHKKVYPYQVWLDGIYMETPFWLGYELYIQKDKASFETAADHVTNQIENVYDKLRNTQTGLYYHGYDAQADSTSGSYNADSAMSWAAEGTGTSANYWLRSMGWYAMALVDNIEILQKAQTDLGADVSAELNSLKAIYVDLMDSLLQYRDGSTYMWYQVPDKQGEEYNYIETSGSAAIAYSLMKGYNLGIVDVSYYNRGLETFNGICDNKLTYTDSSKTDVDLTDICQTAGLAGPSSGTTSSSATIGPKYNKRDGSYNYYVSEKTVTNDAKGVAPLLLAYCQILEYNNPTEDTTATTEATTESTTTAATEATTESQTEATTSVSYVGTVVGGGGSNVSLDFSSLTTGTPSSIQTDSTGVFTIYPGKLTVSEGVINLGGGGNTTKNSVAVNVTGPATLTISCFNGSTRTLRTISSDGTFSEDFSVTSSSESSPLTVSYELTTADTYYIYSTSGGIRITDVTVTYPSSEALIIGDTDLNGAVERADATLLLRHISGITALMDSKQLQAADTDKDNSYTFADVINILKYLN